MPGKVNDQTMEAARQADLVVQPTSPNLDDTHPSLLVFQALENLGIPRERLAFALCRVLSDQEAEAVRTLLATQGYTVLFGHIQEHLGYRRALNTGRGLTETAHQALNVAAQFVVGDILQWVAGHGDGLMPFNPAEGAVTDREKNTSNMVVQGWGDHIADPAATP